jgi:hypothetical protein
MQISERMIFLRIWSNHGLRGLQSFVQQIPDEAWRRLINAAN